MEEKLNKTLKLQSAFELLTTYAWVVLIVSVLVAVVFVISTSKPEITFLPTTCNISPSFTCVDTALGAVNGAKPINYTIEFLNGLQTPILLQQNGFNVTTTGLGVSGIQSTLGNCNPTFATPGTPVICSVDIPGSVQPPIGSKVSTTFAVSYQICQNNNQNSCAAQVYTTTGTALQPLGTSVNLYTLTFITNPTNGTIVLNGVSYVNGDNALLFGGQYTAFALPPPNYAFANWAISSVSSTLSSLSTQNTLLSLSSDAVLTANFNPVLTSTTTISTTTVPLVGLVVATPKPSPTIMDQYQSVGIVSAGAGGGTPPYTYQWLASLNNGAYSPTSLCAAPTSTTCNVITNVGTTTGTYNFELQATDANGKIARSLPATVKLYPQLTSSTYTNPYYAETYAYGQIDAGQSLTLNGLISGGTGRDSYQWLSCPSSSPLPSPPATCYTNRLSVGPQNVIFSYSTPDYYYLEFNTTDVGVSNWALPSPYIVTSANPSSYIQVYPALAPTLTPSSPSIPTSGTVVLTANTNGGIGPFGYTWWVTDPDGHTLGQGYPLQSQPSNAFTFNLLDYNGYQSSSGYPITSCGTYYIYTYVYDDGPTGSATPIAQADTGFSTVNVIGCSPPPAPTGCGGGTPVVFANPGTYHLSSDLITTQNVTIQSGAELYMDGYSIISGCKFNNMGTINSGVSSNVGGTGSNGNAGNSGFPDYTCQASISGGSVGASGGSFGGGGGGGAGGAWNAYYACAGASGGGWGGGGAGGAGGNGGNPQGSCGGSCYIGDYGGIGDNSGVSTVLASTIQSCYSNGMQTCLEGGAGGGGGGGAFEGELLDSHTLQGASGGSGGYGIYIQANTIIAGSIILDAGAGGMGSCNSYDGAGGGGYGGYGGLILSYNGISQYTAGTYTDQVQTGLSGLCAGPYPSGTGFNSGGGGGSGSMLTYDYGTNNGGVPPITP